jgi:hypothetical protein
VTSKRENCWALAARSCTTPRCARRSSKAFPHPDDEVDAITATLLPSYQEVAKEMSSYRQRTVFEGNAELSFYFLNGNVPLQMSKKILDGRDERRVILDKRVPASTRFSTSPSRATSRAYGSRSSTTPQRY